WFSLVGSEMCIRDRFIITAVLSAIFSIWLLARLKPMLATAHLSLED
ncbi:hypothetical protein, partial [Acinetobacter baumannii]